MRYTKKSKKFKTPIFKTTLKPKKTKLRLLVLIKKIKETFMI